MAKPAPVVGQWYRSPGGDSFEVVAIDRDDSTIEIQYFDGTVAELDVEEWIEDDIVSTEPPEDWTGSWTSNPRTPRTSTRPSPAIPSPGPIRCSSWTAAKRAATRRSTCPKPTRRSGSGRRAARAAASSSSRGRPAPRAAHSPPGSRNRAPRARAARADRIPRTARRCNGPIPSRRVRRASSTGSAAPPARGRHPESS